MADLYNWTRHSGRLGWLAAVVAGIVLVLALAMPKHQSVNGCLSRVPLGLGLSFAHNCDSNHILRDARSLPRYLADASPSRARPVHIAAVAGVSHVLAPILVPASRLLAPLQPWIGDLGAFYLAGIIVNAIILALAWMAALRLVGPLPSVGGPLAVMALLATFDVTLAWFWVPHQIFMNVLVPIGGVLAFVTGMRAGRLGTSALAGLGVVAAVGILAYGFALVWPVAFGLGALYAQALERRLAVVPLVRAMLPFGLAFALPVALWFGAFAFAGREIAYEAQSAGQFQWLAEAIQQGNLIPEIAWRLGRFVSALGGYLGVWGALNVLAAVALAVALRPAPVDGDRPRRQDAVVVGALVTGALMLKFNFLQGYHQGRLLLFPILLAQICLLRLLVRSGHGSVAVMVAGGLALMQLAGGSLAPPVSME